MELPERFRSILAEDETVERRFRLRGGTVYTTDRRMIAHSRRSVTGYDYADIAAVSRTTKRLRWLLVPGIVIVVGGGVAEYYGVTQSLFTPGVGLAATGLSLAVGLILGVVGAMGRSERLVVSLADDATVVYKGSVGRLQALLQAIRQKLVAGPPVVAESVEEDAMTGFAATLVLLADLRDKGGISWAGFERLEQEIRRPSASVRSDVAGKDAAGRQSSERRGAAVEAANFSKELDGDPQPVKSDILTALARDVSHGAFDGAGSLLEAATRAGASTNEIAEALGVTQFTSAIGNLYQSSSALRELSLTTAGGTV